MVFGKNPDRIIPDKEQGMFCRAVSWRMGAKPRRIGGLHKRPDSTF